MRTERFLLVKRPLAAALVLLATATSAYAAGLGRLAVESAFGQPLRAEVELTGVTPEQEATLRVRLAPESAFRDARIEMNPALAGLRLKVERRGDRVVVAIESLQAVNEPYLDLILEATWAGGHVQREYTVLLDPPALKQVPSFVLPGEIASAPAAKEPAPVAAAPAAAPAAAAPPAVASAPPPTRPQPVVPPAASAPMAKAPAEPAKGEQPPSTLTVQPGDTLGRIAAGVKPAEVSLDQMLVAFVRANPSTFGGGNMNRLPAGVTLKVPTAEDAKAISSGEARAEVVAQARDFAEYRSRLARVSVAAPAATDVSGSSGQSGQVTTRVAEPPAAAKGGDRLQIAKVEPAAPGAAAGESAKAARADEAVASQRALKEQQERAAELQKANEALRRALELQGKAAGQVQPKSEPNKDFEKKQEPTPVEDKKAEGTAPRPDAAPAPAPTEAAASSTSAPASASPPASPPPPSVAPPAAPTSPAPASGKAPPAVEPAASSTSFLDDLLADPTVQMALGAVAVLLLGWVGYFIWRRRAGGGAEAAPATEVATATGASIFRSSGGRTVDTSSTTQFSSSFIPGASQLDSKEVDPVAEADVYLAYGREDQAEEILKEALRLQPHHRAVQVKLIELYAKRGDRAASDRLLEQMRSETGGSGPEWDQAVDLVRRGGAAPPRPTAQPASLPLTEPVTTTAAPQTPARVAKASLPPDLASLYADVAPAASAAVASAVAEAAAKTAAADTLSAPATRNSRSRGAPSEFQATFGLDAPPDVPTQSNKWGALTKPVDFSALDFDLRMPPTGVGEVRTTASRAPAAVAGAIPDVDLSLPASLSAPAATTAGADTVGRPTLVGTRSADATMMRNAGPATLPPVIDFDLGGIDKDVPTRSNGAKPGSPLAAQMATKLDLARGYIDLGVKDGARELLEEVVRDGTLEQRADALDLLKTIEA